MIYLIENLEESLCLISEVCVEESKWHIESNKAVRKIREYIYNMPSLCDITELKAYIYMKMKKIYVKEYRKIIGLD